MSRTTVKVEIPQGSPDEMVTLASRVEATHLDKDTSSPLGSIDMATFSSKLKSAKEKRDQAKKLHEQAETLNQQANLDLGIDNTQNSKTGSTVYSFLVSIRNVLLGVYNGKEEELSNWGFKVVRGTVSRTNTKTGDTK